MIENPFLEAIAFTSNSELQTRLGSAGVMWNLLTENEAPNNQVLCHVLLAHRFDNLWFAYQFQNPGEYDARKFGLLIKVWVNTQTR